ncbi:MAG: hypothetical protein WCI21_09765 [Alphaproteobacteria bacterium]
MFTNIIRAAAFALTAAATVSAGTGAAVANNYGTSTYGYTNTYQADYGHWETQKISTPRQVCEKIYETKRWHDYYGWHSQQIYVGEKCATVYDVSYVKVWVASY